MSHHRDDVEETATAPLDASMLADQAAKSGISISALGSIKPLQDLARNFDIDISTWLGEYLRELLDADEASGLEAREFLAGTSKATSRTNFTTAALLLQNSSHVYSRKVEYLHSLVLSALSDLLQNKAALSTGNKSSAKANPLVEDFLAFDSDLNFLPLDDVLAKPRSSGGVSITLTENADENTSCDDNPPLDRTVARISLGMSMSMTRLDYTSVTSSAQGVFKVAALDMMNNLLDDGLQQGGTSLRLQSGRCNTTPSGRLVIPGSLAFSQQGNNVQQQPHQSPSSHELPSKSPTTSLNQSPVGDHMEDDADAVGFNMLEHDDAGGDDSDVKDNSIVANERNSTPTPEESCTLPDPRAQSDPWELLDPHDSSESQARPLRVRNTLKLPPELSDIPSAHVNGTRTKKRPVVLQNRVAPNFPYSSKHHSVAWNAFLAIGPHFQEGMDETAQVDDSLTHITNFQSTGSQWRRFREEFRHVFNARLSQQRAKQKVHRFERITDVGDLRQERTRLLPPDAIDGSDDDVMPIGYDGGLEGDDDDYGPLDDDCDELERGNASVTSIDDAFRNEAAVEDSSQHEKKTFEDLCRAHLATIAKDVEKHASNAVLVQRVDKWQEGILPFLHAQSARRPFDMSAQKRELLDSIQTEELKDEKTTHCSKEKNGVAFVDFSLLTEHCQHYEVCNLFLATLQLCNDKKVVIADEESVGDFSPFETLQLRLVND